MVPGGGISPLGVNSSEGGGLAALGVNSLEGEGVSSNECK